MDNIQSKDYTLQQFVDIMAEYHPRLLPVLHEVAAMWPEQSCITAITYNYETLDAKGEPIIMSALMLIPKQNGRMCANSLWLENRATQSANQNVPSNRWNIGEVHVLQNRVLVSADLMSFGASIDRPICYCHSALAARNTVDAVMAAQAWLLSEKIITEPLPVYNSGHSQGGFDALAVHRYMETQATDEERRLLPLVRTYCADGPYLPDVLTRIVAAREKYLYGAYMVMNAMSHLNYHSEFFRPDITIDDFLTREARELGIAETIARKDVGNSDLVKIVIAALGLKTSALFVEDVYKEGGQIYRMMMRCSEAERLIDGWQPQLPIDFYHAHYDECVPVECMTEVEKVWGALPNVHFVDDMTPLSEIEKGLAHAYSGGVFHRELLLKNIHK